MKNNLIITAILLVLLISVLLFLLPKGKNNSLVNPVGDSIQLAPSPSPEAINYNPFKEIKYDKNTNLNQELDKVNPKVLDNDFSL